MEHNKITGEDVAALLHGIHTHAGEITNTVAAARNDDFISEKEVESKIYYAEEDLLPILEALGLPKPVWGKSMDLQEWLDSKTSLQELIKKYEHLYNTSKNPVSRTIYENILNDLKKTK